ncbi:receptor-transporting protein 3-like [Hyla sarda]|uniref:receptor-transporting protein 3-like n=1 Tax=Hyla sarda TaxID=327740 RepID=UPI0024C453E0|nr:receptor-transporting protein 3-like [Hyla sarda]
MAHYLLQAQTAQSTLTSSAPGSDCSQHTNFSSSMYQLISVHHLIIPYRGQTAQSTLTPPGSDCSKHVNPSSSLCHSLPSAYVYGVKMELWEDEFYNEIEERGVPDDWEFYEDVDLDMQERGAKYTQHTFARFKCSSCKRWWNSAEVHVVFFMTLNRSLQQGTVRMRIFRQECKQCSVPELETPEISHENIIRIIKNLVNRIPQVFYGERKLKQDFKPEIYGKDREGPHDKEHCEACKLMICNWTVVTKKQPAVQSSSATKKPKHKQKTHKKEEQCQSSTMISNVFTSTPTYSDYEADVRSTPTYPNYEENIAPKKKHKPKKRKKNKQCQPNRMTSPSVFTFTPTYPEYEDFRSTPTYSDYEDNMINLRYTTAYSPPRKKETSTFPILTSVILGIGALALWYLKK